MARAQRTIGVDTGGTFTDLVLRSGEEERVHKLPSTPEAPGRAVLAGLEALGGSGADTHVVHGTTVALNAMLTGRVAKTALVTGAGFRDLVEIGRQERPDIYALHPRRTAPLVPRARRFAVGEQMYAKLGIPREDKPSRLMWFARNFEFFGAPTAMFFTMDRQMQEGQWSDLGMFLQSIALLAREHGLHTAFQEAWAVWTPTIVEILGIPENEMLFCGMGIGWEDPDHALADLRTDRAELDALATFHGF